MSTEWHFTVSTFDHGQVWIEPGYGTVIARNRVQAFLLWLTLRKAPARWTCRKVRRLV